MKKKTSILTFVTVLFFIIGNNISRAQFVVDAQLRSRLELRDGYQKLALQGSSPAAFISQRSRLSFSYHSENFKLKFSPQDVRIWGDEANHTLGGNMGDAASLDLFEAYAELKLGKTGWVSAGRQLISYDNEWLLGSSDWNQNGSSSDAVIFKLKPRGWNIHLGASWNSKKEVLSGNLYPSNLYKSMNYLWLNKAISENWTLSMLHISAGRTQTDSTSKLNFRHSSGFYSVYRMDDINLTGNVYYQYGKSQAGNPVSAYFFALDASYKAGKLTPGLGITYHSGNSREEPDSGKDNVFDLMFTSRHKFFGFMDYFRTISADTRQGGVTDYYIYLDYKLSKTVSIRNLSHYFQLAQTNPTTPPDKNLGFENDLVLKYSFSEWGALETGYMFFLPENSLEIIQDVPESKFSQFLYLQLTLKPSLFRQSGAE